MQSEACGPKVSTAYLDCLGYSAKDGFIYSLCHESNGEVDLHLPPILRLHTASVLPTFSGSRYHAVSLYYNGCRALIMRTPASQRYVGTAAFDVATRSTRSAGCKRSNALVNVDRAVYGCMRSLTTKIGFDPAADSIPIRQDRIRSEFSTRIGSKLRHHTRLCRINIGT